MAARPFFSSSSCRRCARCGRPGRLGTCSVAARASRRVVGGRPSAFSSAARTWPCLRSSPFSGGRPAFLLARRRLVDLRSARARFDLFLVGSLHLAQDAPFVLQLGSALLLGVMRLAEMPSCRRDGPRSKFGCAPLAAQILVCIYANFFCPSGRRRAGPLPVRDASETYRAVAPAETESPLPVQQQLCEPPARRVTTHASPKDASKCFHI